MGYGHSTGGKRRDQELLYDASIATPTHAERATTLAHGETTGTLCTLAKEPQGYPYGSFITFAFEASQPLFLISALAEHTKNLSREPRCSLLISQPGEGDPLARGRVTLVGRCARVPSDATPSAKDAYLKTHPNASYYVDFKDFSLWRLDVEQVRYIGGYGRMSWISGDEWASARPDPIAPHSSGIIAHMNADHEDAMIACCHAFSRATEVARVRMTGVDRYGFEMSAETEIGPRPIRVAFSEEASNAIEVREQVVALVKRARDLLSDS